MVRRTTRPEGPNPHLTPPERAGVVLRQIDEAMKRFSQGATSPDRVKDSRNNDERNR